MYGLIDSILDNLDECFVKLGFTDAPLSFNYPLRTLAALLGMVSGGDGGESGGTRAVADSALNNGNGEITSEALLGELTRVLDGARDVLGECSLRARKSGYSITVPREGVRRAYSRFDKDGFLPSLLSRISTHGVTAEDIHGVFESARVPFEVHLSSDEDIDEFITVTDGSDPYIYLFKFEEEHCDYHRLLPVDFYEIYGK